MKWGVLACGFWVLASLLLRPAAPIDETRYLAVAWEMHLANAWQVPTLDGHPYAHKPPLLFWLIRLGWEAFGVNEWWPRLLPALAGLASLALTIRVGSAVGLRDSKWAAAVLLACLAGPVYASVLLFDLLLTTWVMLAWWGLLQAPSKPRTATAWTALAIGLGILTKGPVVLLYVIPAGLFLPSAKRSIAFAVPLGAAIALAWALPAAQAGGESYSNAILWGQTAGRVHDSFSHARPFWWYFPIVVLLGLPWTLRASSWALCRNQDPVLRPMRRATLLSFCILLLLSGKQPHYLLPMLPIAAILLTAHAAACPMRFAAFRKVCVRTSIAIPLLLTIGLLALRSRSDFAFDLRPAAQVAAQAQFEKRPVVWAGDSHGQLSFHGRLERPVIAVAPHGLVKWLRARPHALVALPQGAAERVDLWQDGRLAHASHIQAFRGEQLAMLPAWALLDKAPSFATAIASGRANLQEALEQRRAGPGISVAVGYRGQVVWSEGFGYADIETQRPVQADTLFRIGSVSKPLTAVALMRLVDQEKLELEDSVHDWLPDYPAKPWPILLRQLAGHLGGIRHYRGAEFLSTQHYLNVGDALAVFADDPLLHQPDTRYAYSSYGFTLLSAAMAQAAGVPFLQLMQDEVFTPLGLTRTLADDAQQVPSTRSSFYSKLAGYWVPAPQVDLSNKWAGGGFLSCPEDLVQFGFHMLGSGHLSNSARNAMLSSRYTVDGARVNYGIGWSLRLDPQRGQVWSHSGGSVGGSTHFIVYPNQELILALTINSGGSPAVALASQLAKDFLQVIDQAQTDQAW